MTRVRGRFAPTPSGYLHLGNAWSALLAWLHVRSQGGTFILRMEDIDRPRCRPQYAAQVLADLRWLGIDWDEGPDVGGPYGPYTQSERSHWYDDALAKLSAGGWLYPCFCSRAQLQAIAAAPHGLASEGPAYPGTCRHLSPAERAQKAQKKMPSWRFACPDHPVRFTDLILGPQWFPPGAGGDFVVKRADGIIAYQLAVVVDDAAMGVTHVLRGADLLDSTPRQLWLYAALGCEPPAFAHVPLVFGPGGQRLAKRDRSLTLSGLRASGVGPERITGALAFLARLMPKPEPVRPEELKNGFDLAHLPNEPVQFDAHLLAWLTGP